MNYWRMQLHPDQPSNAAGFTAQCLIAGFVGLDHDSDIGDMRHAQNRLPPSQRDYFDIALRMQVGDKILIIAHHWPFAFATVSSEYFYISEKQPELGVWFRHFRRVENVRFVADVITNLQLVPQLTMTDTIACLGTATKSYQFIRENYA